MKYAVALVLLGVLVSCAPPIPTAPSIVVLLEGTTTTLQTGGSVSFGNVAWGNTKELTFTIRNNGTADLTLTATEKVQVAGLNPEAFALSKEPDGVVPANGGSTRFSIRFSPSTVGIKAALVSIKTDVTDPQSISFMLAGTGVKGWRIVGTAGFSAASVDSLSFALDSSSGTPYVVYTEDYYPSVQKFVSGAWNAVGDPGSDLSPTFYSPAICATAGSPYLAFSYPNDGYPVGTAYYDPDTSQWTGSGSFDYASAPAQYLRLVEDSFGVLYAAYRDHYNGDALSIYSNGDGWYGYATGFTPNPASYASMAFCGDIPYVAFKDDVTGRANVYYDRGGMTPYGDQDFSDSDADYTSIALDSVGRVYVAYSDGYNDGRVTVMSNHNEAEWTPVGEKGFSPSAATEISLAVASDNTLYIAFKDAANGGKLTVEKFNGTSWEAVGTAGCSSGTADFISLACHQATPFVAFSDGSHGGKVTVMKLE